MVELPYETTTFGVKLFGRDRKTAMAADSSSEATPIQEPSPSPPAPGGEAAEDENCCAICLDELDPSATGNAACATLPCMHSFHVQVSPVLS